MKTAPSDRGRGVNFLRESLSDSLPLLLTLLRSSFLLRRRLSGFLGCVLHRLFSLTSNLRSSRDHSCDSYIRSFAFIVKKKMHVKGHKNLETFFIFIV